MGRSRLEISSPMFAVTCAVVARERKHTSLADGEHGFLAALLRLWAMGFLGKPRNLAEPRLTPISAGLGAS